VKADLTAQVIFPRRCGGITFGIAPFQRVDVTGKRIAHILRLWLVPMILSWNALRSAGNFQVSCGIGVGQGSKSSKNREHDLPPRSDIAPHPSCRVAKIRRLALHA